MDPTFEQSIASAVTSAVAAAVDKIKTKHKEEMLALREMIEKSLLFMDSSSSTPPSNRDAAPKADPATDFLSKAATERLNQADLDYFNPHLDMANDEGEIVLVGKNVYHRNVVFFVQRHQSLVTFRGAALVKANIASSLRGFALEWYTSKLSNFDRNTLNNNPGVKS